MEAYLSKLKHIETGPHEYAQGNGGKEKLPSKRKKPWAEPDSEGEPICRWLAPVY